MCCLLSVVLFSDFFSCFVCLFHFFVLFVFVYLFIYLFTCLLPVSGWLKDEDHDLIRRVSLRIEDVTGLTMDTAEELQVCTVKGGVRKIVPLLKKGDQVDC